VGETIKMPPTPLSERARSIWAAICQGWELDEAELVLLEQALKVWDRLQDIQNIIEAKGPVVKFADGHFEPSKMLKAERDCYAMFSRLWRQLKLSEGFVPVGAPGVGLKKRRKPEKKGEKGDMDGLLTESTA